MGCERSGARRRVRCWERRIGNRLDAQNRAVDPVKEINPRLFPNNQLEAWLWPVTSDRSLARPFTPLAGLRRSPTIGACLSG